MSMDGPRLGALPYFSRDPIKDFREKLAYKGQHRKAPCGFLSASSMDLGPILARSKKAARLLSNDLILLSDALALGGERLRRPILNGAHIVIEGDGGRYYEKWQKLSPLNERFSSHYLGSRLGRQYSVNGPKLTEVLFGIKRHNGKVSTWFQAERSSTEGSSILSHLRDFMAYKITGKNIGPCGVSVHTDQNPIVLKV